MASLAFLSPPGTAVFLLYYKCRKKKSARSNTDTASFITQNVYGLKTIFHFKKAVTVLKV